MTSISANQFISRDIYPECSHLFDLAILADGQEKIASPAAKSDAEKHWNTLMEASFFAADESTFRNTCLQAPIHLLVLSLALEMFLANNAEEFADQTKRLLVERMEFLTENILPAAQQRLVQLIENPSDNRQEKAALKLLVHFGAQEQLGALKNITALDLSNESITDDALSRISKMTNLKGLNLSGTLISPRALVFLQGLKSLQKLNLEGVAIDSRSLQPLRGLESLQELNISNTQAYDDVISDLTYLGELRKLNVSKTNFTDDGVRQLRAWLPDCEVIF